MQVKTLLSSTISVTDYKEMEKNCSRDLIANFFEQRILERYVMPMRVPPDKKNGFTIMAVSCLLIETLESFNRGWADSKNKSEQAFCSMFDRHQGFTAFRGLSQSFYKNIRCGILHQGETTGGWHIRRDGPIFDANTKTINAKLFHDEVEGVLKSYCNKLRHSEWSSPVWQLFRKKMHAVCKNCESDK